MLTSCAAMPDFFKSADDVLTDTAIKIEISKEAIPAGSTVSTDIRIVPRGNPDTSPVK